MSMYKCVQMDLHFLVYEYVKLFTKALFATVLTGGRVVTYQYWSDRFYRKPHNTSPEHFLESNPNTFIHTKKSLLYISLHTHIIPYTHLLILSYAPVRHFTHSTGHCLREHEKL